MDNIPSLQMVNRIGSTLRWQGREAFRSRRMLLRPGIGPTIVTVIDRMIREFAGRQ
jgi:hypothetical protein